MDGMASRRVLKLTQATGTGRGDGDQESLETHFSMTGTQCTNKIWSQGYCPNPRCPEVWNQYH